MNLEYALKLLDISLKYNRLYNFYLGFPGFELNARNGYGESEHNYPLVMKAIYEKYKSDSKIANDFYSSIIDFLNVNRNGKHIITILNLIKYQMNSEKEGKAPFKLDCDKLLLAVKENIKRNMDLYNDLSTKSFMREFMYYNEDLEKNYGRKIL